MAYLKRILLVCAVLAVSGVTLVAASRPVMAQPADGKTKAAALEAFKAGKKAFDAEDWETAVGHFKEADRLYPGASPKHKIAVCLDNLGRIKQAIAAYETFINSDPGPKYAERVKASKARVAELEEKLAAMPGKVTLTIEPAAAEGLAVTVDGNPADGVELELAGGDHTIVVEATGMETVTRQITVEPGGEQEVSITLQGAVAPPPPPPPGGEEDSGTDQGLLIGGLVSAGVAVVGWGVFTAFGVMAMGSKSDFDETPTTELADDTEQQALIADIGLAAGGVGTVLAVILIPMALAGDDDEGAGDTAMPQLTPLVGPEATGMAATWTF